MHLKEQMVCILFFHEYFANYYSSLLLKCGVHRFISLTYWQNAVTSVTEFIEVGKPIRALDALAEVIKSKKYRSTTYSEKVLEPIMIKYLELCVDLKKAYMAKEGLFQYRNMCQSVRIN